MFAESAPSGLPPRPVSMLQRSAERAALRTALEQDRSIVVVQGLGGTGKTSLALVVAHEIQGTRQFESAIWTSARDTRLTFEDMLRQTARALGRADIAAVAADELEPILHPVLQDRSILLVVDNFETVAPDEQGRMLGFARWLSPPSRVLLTSRHADFQARIPDISPPLRVVPLGGLTASETRQLFVQEVERQGVDALRGTSAQRIDEVFEVTAGHPLAIRLLVAEAQSRPLVHILRDVRASVRGRLDALFEYTWQRLGDAALRTLQAVSLLGGPVSRECIAAMTSLSVDAVERAAAELESVSLLESRGQQIDGTALFGVHPLTRAFARARVQAEDELAERLMERAARFYLDLVNSNSDFMDERGHERLERERETILSVRDWCDAHERLPLLITLGQALGNFFWVRGWAQDRITSGKLARRAAATLGWAWEEGEILSRELGWGLLQLGEHDKAQDYLDEARVLLEAQGHTDELASCWRYLAQIARRRGDSAACRAMLDRALEVAAQIPDDYDRTYAEARTKVDCGYLSLDRGDAVAAAADFQYAVDFFARVGDEIRMAYALNGLGDAALNQQHLDDAARHYRHSLEIADRFQSRPGRARALLRLATLHAQTGQLQRAVDDASEAERLAQQLGLVSESRAATNLLTSLRSQPDPLHVDVEQELVRLNGEDVHLEPLAVQLLALLNEKQGELCTHADICEKLWPGTRLVPDALPDIYVLVHDIQSAIKRHVPKSVKLSAVRGRGYKLTIST